MENPNISAEIAPVDKTAIETNAAAIWLILKFLVNLDPKTRKKLRKMATKRTGYVNDVFNAVLAYPDVIPDSFKLAEYKKDKQLHEDLVYVFNILNPIVEALGDTLLMLGNELMTQSDTCYDYLKRGAKDSAPLTETITQIGTAYKKSSPKQATVFTLPPSGSVVVDNVVAGTKLVNNGSTILKYTESGKILIQGLATLVILEPGNAAVISKGVNKVTVENQSTTLTGSFAIRTK